ncbi:uncharacterized protein LOC127866222 [Dreissena polymorpha]|uniref:uncharacterized protein LOC127866222 n=1 Tax=Dreissena polymorpha TaxID=45954 RepID=UPI002263B293|nr:uncharacterized protein LOC127866222 [Dreissena polymorpha]
MHFTLLIPENNVLIELNIQLSVVKRRKKSLPTDPHFFYHISGKKEMTEWLKSEILPLTADPTDKFCELEEIRHPDLYEEGKQSLEGNAEKSEVPLRRSPRKSVTSDVTPKKRHLERSEGSPIVPHSARKVLKLEGTPGSSQYLSSRVGSNRKDASGNKIKRLEEDVRSLRRKLGKLEDRVSELDKDKASNSTTEQVVEKADRTGQLAKKKEGQGSVSKKEADSILETKPCQAICEQDVEAIVGKAIGNQNKFKNLCLYKFTREELVSCTRTGKRTIKCMDNVKPQLDHTKFKELETLVLKYTLYDKQSFQKKLKTYRKFLEERKMEQSDLTYKPFE